MKRSSRHSRAAARIMGILLAASWPACAIPEDAPALDIAHTSTALTAPNGLMFNGLAPNGIMFNGIMFNGIMFNGIMFNGLDMSTASLNDSPLDAEQEANLIQVLAYVVECALPEGQQVIIHDSKGSPITYQGALGLAPEWRDGPLSPDGAHLVSACLAARSNALERTVLVSLRTPRIRSSLQEQDIFTTHEGVFWGNLFSSTPYIQACVVKGGGLSGRVCAQTDTCGFEILGDCSQVCELDEARGEYVRCAGPGGRLEDKVINTFLSLGHQTTHGEHNICTIDRSGGPGHGQVSCWGDNAHGQLADGTTKPSRTPMPLLQLDRDNAEIAAGLHTCARKRDGDLYCWGRNEHGQAGAHAREDQHDPVYIGGDFAEVGTGYQHTCARKTDGSVWCWGSNRHGQLGREPRSDAPQPPQALAGIDAIRLSTSTSAFHTCAIRASGTLWCWGSNTHGQLGLGSGGASGSPAPVARDEHGKTFTDVTDVCTARSHTCARKADGSAWCWGTMGDFRPQRPRRLFLGNDKRAAAPGGLACGTGFACFVAADATVWCLGNNEHGQLGYATRSKSSNTLHPVQNLTGMSFVSAGLTHTCATSMDGATHCWGSEPGPVTGRPEVVLFPGVALTMDPVQIPLP